MWAIPKNHEENFFELPYLSTKQSSFFMSSFRNCSHAIIWDLSGRGQHFIVFYIKVYIIKRERNFSPGVKIEAQNNFVGRKVLLMMTFIILLFFWWDLLKVFPGKSVLWGFFSCYRNVNKTIKRQKKDLTFFYAFH